MIRVYFAQKAFLVHNGRLLAVRRSADDDRHPLKWEVPGGRLEAAESLDEHIIREVREETGILISPGGPFFVWKWNINSDSENSPDCIVAVARLCTAQTTLISTAGRVAQDYLDLTEWIPLSNLAHYEWISNMRPVLDAFL